MLQFLLGLATIPAIVGVAAGLYGLWRAGGWLLDHSPIVRLQRRDQRPDQIAGLTGAIVSTPSLWALNLSRYVCVLVAVGKVDAERADAVRRGVYRELVPPVRLTRIRKGEAE